MPHAPPSRMVCIENSVNVMFSSIALSSSIQIK
jgi:hypothetical protein